jgi:hypothetical protein
MAAPSSTTKAGKNEPFELQVARGQISWHRTLFKYGSNPDITTVEETVWSQGGIYSYPSAASVMSVSSSSANDAGAGTGARTVTVSGLDANYNEISETITLSGQTGVNTTLSFLRVFRAFVVTAGSGGTAAGTIYVGTGTITLGVPANIYSAIPLGANQTLMSLWTVPAGYTAYLLGGKFSASSNNASHTALGRFLFRPFGGVFRVAADVTLNNGFANYNFILPLAIPEKSDIETRAIALSGSGFYVTASFEIMYIKNDAGVP